jgi:hypothetical protein
MTHIPRACLYIHSGPYQFQKRPHALGYSMVDVSTPYVSPVKNRIFGLEEKGIRVVLDVLTASRLTTWLAGLFP